MKVGKVSIAVLVESLIIEKLSELNIDVVEVQYRKEPDGQMLRVFIDTDTGVSLDTCSQATRIIQKQIDDQKQIYYDHLEVSSPGIDRVLKKEQDYQKFRGEQIKVKLFKPIEGQKTLTGKLLDCDEKNLTIEIEDHPMKIPRDSVSIVRLDPEI
jgi:ribosome maturation factor RimP